MKMVLDQRPVRMMALAFAIHLIGVASHQTQGAIVYSAPGSLYSENFDSLPTQTTNNAALQPTPYVQGWMDDTTTDLSHVSVPGWYLYHGLMPAGAEIGFNGHQRFRIGSANAATSRWERSEKSEIRAERIETIGA